jgi:protoporphyrinogen oxidase/glycosyltransferase involved in cell wall biosynthesis
MPARQIAFESFWTGGFEGADHVNGHGVELDMNALTGHVSQLRGDYRRVRAAGMRAVRETVGWRVAAREGRAPDFSRAIAKANEARRQRLGVAWTLWHYGFPQGVDPFCPSLATRFAEFADAFALALGRYLPDDVWVNPVNEISFLTWLLTETQAIHSYRGDMKSRAAELKHNLVRAAIAATAAIRARIPGARFFHTDPVIHIAAVDAHAEADAAREREAQFEAWDLLANPGFEPHVPVRERFHLVGANYYHSSQWEVESRAPLHWHLRDPRRRSLASLARAVAGRYAMPVALTETSHVGSGRAEWIEELARELEVDGEGSPACAGVCLYPVVDRPDWDDVARWHRTGLWDVVPRAHRSGGRRVAHRPSLAALARAGARGEVSNLSTVEGMAMKTLVVFSHLRWDFVYQRPQHVVSRLAKRWRVVFVEEPVFHAGPARVELVNVDDGVTVLRFHTPIAAQGFHDDQLAALQPLLAETLRDLDVGEYGVWFYTPMALPLLRELSPSLIVYDCMDELAAFRNPPRQLLQRERALLRIANVVFTGGPSLFRSKRGAHDNVHCIPSAVDAGHFARARNASEACPMLAALPSPRLGFYGVVDERFDADLLAGCAELRPDWQFCIVGPVVKIDPALLPRRPNIHYQGQRSYAELPGVLAAWDVALLPFARNESTKFISPTKTLEYLAAGKPVVSTSIADVVELYGAVVRIADGAETFVAQCAAALHEDAQARNARQDAARAIVAGASWDGAVLRMQAEVERALPQGLRPDVDLLFSETGRVARKPVAADCLVVGAGPTGLAAAHRLGRDATLLEAAATVGGGCRSVCDGGFTFDRAGHIMFSQSEVVQELYQTLLGDNVLWQDREAWIYSHDTYTRYPFQGALYGLPPPVMKECLMGAIEARYGVPAAKGSAKVEHVDCCADGTGIDEPCAVQPRNAEPRNAEPANFEEFIHRTWGRGIARHFALPYNRKLWGVPLTEMETSWLGGRVPLPDLEQMIEGALSPVARPMGPNARFGYPLRGGFQALMDGFLPLLDGPLHLDARVTRLHPARHEAELADGRVFRYDSMIATIPLPDLVRAIGDEAPAAVRQAAARLRRVSVRCVNLGIGRPALTEKHWIYYPEDTIFHRIFVQGNASPLCNAEGGFGLTCEITYSSTKPLPLSGQALIDRCVADCIRVGIIRDTDPVWVANEVDIPYAYVLYDHARAQCVATIRNWLAPYDIVLAGRYSEWEYYNSDHAFLAGRRAADLVRDGDQRKLAQSA